MKFQDDISNMNTYIHTYVHTYGQAETNMPPHFFKVGGIKICVCYFSMRNPYMKFQDDISFRNIIVAKFQGPKF